MSGDDSGLKNLWEAYCVQIQTGESFQFEEYEEMVFNFCIDEVKTLTLEEKLAILMTSPSNSIDLSNWEDEAEAKSSYQEIHADNELVALDVKYRLDAIAEEYTSPDIEKYLRNADEEE